MIKGYRPGVGAMIRKNNQILVAKRLDGSSGMQMPQGGIESDESLEEVLFRELEEEIGTKNCTILGKIKMPLYYDFPQPLVNKIYNGKYQGQGIFWFLLDFVGHDSEINLNTSHREFLSWDWTRQEHLVDGVVAFKKTMYATVLNCFSWAFK
jgi:putative (di)nucleoside polyphosphate hydrolase